MTSPPPRRRGQPSRRTIGRSLAVLITLLLAAIGAGRLAAVSPLLDLASHFQPHYLAAALLLLLLGVALRLWRCAVAAAICVALTAPRVLPWYLPHANPASTGHGPTIRVILANVLRANQRHDQLLALVRQWKPDVLVLLEIDERWLHALAPLTDRMPYSISEPRDDHFGIAVVSRLPLHHDEIATLGSAGVRSIVCEIELENTRATLIATHPLPPLPVGRAPLRDEQLLAVARRASRVTGPAVLIGDLNATMWSRPYRQLTRQTDLVNARRGCGILPTWPASFPPFMRIPIDHCLHSRDIHALRCVTGQPIGSDHLPLIVDLALPPNRGSAAHPCPPPEHGPQPLPITFAFEQ